METKNKIIALVCVVLVMISYIGWSFYISEPKYENDCNRNVGIYDFITLNEYSYSSGEIKNVDLCIVIQTSKDIILVKKMNKYTDTYLELNKNKNNYRVVGKGTIYHKVNNYVGFNIMQLSQIFSVLLISILVIVIISLTKNLF